MSGFTVTRSQPELWNVTFNNPPANLVDPEMILELRALVDQVEHDPEATVVVFDSANVDHFLGPYDMSRAADTPSAPAPVPPASGGLARRTLWPPRMILSGSG
jgi:enoyl-CoA hydratase/carnithine racemase